MNTYDMTTENLADTSRVVEHARAALASGVKRDDIYHMIMRYAAKNGLDRYGLWQRVVE